MITPRIKHKIKLYTGILILAVVLGWGIYYFVDVSQASAQGSQEEGTEIPDLEPGNEEPGIGEPGDQDLMDGEPGNEEPDSAEPDNEDPGTGDVAGESGTAISNGIMSYAVSRAAQVGVVTVNSTLNVRSGPGTTYDIIGSIAKGTTVTILAEENGWYKINYGQKEGYVSKDYIKLQEGDSGTTADSGVDEAYVQQLMAAGFPKSYAVLLAGLHAKHPAWIFQPVQTGLDWNTVIEKESKLGTNLVSSSFNDSRKSTAQGAYDWSTNKWYGYDGASWVAANSSYIAYCMDPRNFLDETHVFMFESLSYDKNQTLTGVQAITKGTFMAQDVKDTDGTVLNYANAFLEIGKETGVSPYHLASRVRQEQGTGTSGLISGTYPGYEGYFNYFNVSAVNNSSGTATVNGLKKAKQEGWSTRRKSILGGAKLLAESYIKKGQDTLYFEKFNVVYKDLLYSHQYMTNISAPYTESQTVAKGYTDKEQPFVFRIPLYKNMPENVVTHVDTGNPNNWLSSLSITGYNMTPAFNGGTTDYSIVVGANVSSVTVSAKAVAGTSKVSGAGTYNLNYGNNTIKVTCTSQSGVAREYRILIARQGGGSAPVAKGDVNSDGKISNADVVKIKRHILALDTLTGDAFTAADVNGDGKVSNADVVKIKRHILGLELIR